MGIETILFVFGLIVVIAIAFMALKAKRRPPGGGSGGMPPPPPPGSPGRR